MKIWEPMSQKQVNQLSIQATLGKNVRFYWAEGSQMERTSIIGFFFDEELQKVRFRFTTYDDDLEYEYYSEFDPLTAFGYLQLTSEKALELAETLHQEAALLTENSEKSHLFREIKASEYESFGIPIKHVSYDNYQHYLRHLSLEKELQFLNVGRITGYISENHDISVALCNIASSTEKPYQAFDHISQALIETTKAGLQQIAEIIKKVAESE
jgi:hypothetical protein